MLSANKGHNNSSTELKTKCHLTTLASLIPLGKEREWLTVLSGGSDLIK